MSDPLFAILVVFFVLVWLCIVTHEARIFIKKLRKYLASPSPPTDKDGQIFEAAEEARRDFQSDNGGR